MNYIDNLVQKTEKDIHDANVVLFLSVVKGMLYAFKEHWANRQQIRELIPFSSFELSLDQMESKEVQFIVYRILKSINDMDVDAVDTILVEAVKLNTDDKDTVIRFITDTLKPIYRDEIVGV